jgi:hypothetical protein
MISDLIVAILTLDIIVSFDIIFVFVIPLVALLTSLPMKSSEECLWNFYAL